MSNEERRKQMVTEAKAYKAKFYDDEPADSKAKEKIEETFTDFCAGWLSADKSRWISVKDELPKHDTEENGLVSFPIVLVCLYDGYRDTTYYDDMGEEWGDYDGEVEYWMPLPTPPTQRKED